MISLVKRFKKSDGPTKLVIYHKKTAELFTLFNAASVHSIAFRAR
jgi:hypothetical protein